MIRIVLADDHRVVLEGLRALFELEDDMEVVAICTDGAELLNALPETEADVVVFDHRMPNMTGLELLAELNRCGADVRTTLLAGTLSDEEVLQALQLGVQGIVLKEDAAEAIRDCVRRVHAGERWWPAELMQRALDTALRSESDRRAVAEDLTPRELEIVRHVAAGASNKRIAHALTISEGTVKTHLHSIFKKVDVSNRVQLTLFAQEQGLVEQAG
jgi:two-component system nitrate/nitrite response regulator NarL